MNAGEKFQFVIAKNVNLRDFGANLTVFSQRKGMEL